MFRDTNLKKVNILHIYTSYLLYYLADCNVVPLMKGATSDKSHLKHGEEVTYTCDEGHTFHGPPLVFKCSLGGVDLNYRDCKKSLQRNLVDTYL